jgi:putative ABC transport system permease protein
MKTLGFSGGRILRLVLGESVLLALLGGLPGLAVAALVIFGMKADLMQFLPLLTFPVDIVLGGIAIMLVLGLVTGLVPAVNAMRLNIVTALGRS